MGIKIEILIHEAPSGHVYLFAIIFLCRHALLLNKELHIHFYAVGLNYTNVVVFFFSKSVVMNNKREHGPASGDTPGKSGKKMAKKPQRPGAVD